MTFREALESGKFVVTAEVGPGKGTDVEHSLKDAAIIKDRVDAINVTDLQSSVMRLGSMAFCHLLTETQGIYDLDMFEKFMKRVEGFGTKILGGVILLKSVGMARFMNRNVAGVFVPEPVVQELKEAKDKTEASINIAVRLVRGMKDLCHGVHIMALGWESKIPPILDAAGL